MYHFVDAIPNTENAIVRPVIYSIVKSLMCEGMLPKIKRVEYNEAIKRAKLNGSALCNRAARLKCEEFVTISAQTEYRTDDDRWIRSWSRHSVPVWEDSGHGLSVTPLYDEIKLTLTIQIVSTSLSKLRMWKDLVRVLQRRGRERVDHAIEYAMPFPREAYNWFCDMYGLQADEEQYESVKEMIMAYGSNALDVISSGTHYEMVTSQYQTNAKGTMVQTTPQISKLINGSYTGEVEYIIEYNKPTSMLFEYPIMVHQKIIPHKYLPRPHHVNNWYYTESPMDAMNAMDTKYPHRVLNVPSFDTVKLTQFPSFYEPIVTVLVEVDKNIPLALFNLESLGTVELNVDVLDVIRKYYVDEITQHRGCPFLLTIHNDEELMGLDVLTMDCELDITLTRPMDVHGIYRISFCILTSTAALSQQAYYGLTTSPTALGHYVNNVNAIPPSGTHKLGSRTHGINRYVIPSDFESGHYLKQYSPLICISKHESEDPWDYKPITEWARGSAGNHIHVKTVETLNIQAGSIDRDYQDSRTHRHYTDLLDDPYERIHKKCKKP